MKQSFSAVKWFMLVLVCVGISSNALADTAKVIRIKGAARYSATANDQWVTLREGDILKAGAVIQTASESIVDLLVSADSVAPSPVVRRFSPSTTTDAAQNTIRLRENTVLALDKLSSEQTGADVVTDYQLDLRAGHILGNVKKLSAASRYEVKLPNGVAGVRGTLFDLGASGSLTVYFGSVTITYYDANNLRHTTTVNAGNVLDLKTGNQTPIPAGNRPDSVQAGNSIAAVLYTREDGTQVTISPVMGKN